MLNVLNVGLVSILVGVAILPPGSGFFSLPNAKTNTTTVAPIAADDDVELLGYVSGYATFPDGSPVSNGDAYLLDQAGNEIPDSHVITKTTGCFGFDAIPVGTYQVMVKARRAGQIYDGKVPADVQWNQVTEVTVTITPTGYFLPVGNIEGKY